MTHIYLVRHGNTPWTGYRLIGSLPGVPLDDLGRKQAARAADFLADLPIKAIFSSPFQRAWETAAVLAQRLCLPVQSVDFLREVDFGNLCGTPAAELKELPVWQAFYRQPAGVTFPQGEFVPAAQTRIVAGLNHLCKQFATDEMIVCFSHCEILRLALAAALCMPLTEFTRLTLLPGSISCVNWESAHQSIQILNLIPG